MKEEQSSIILQNVHVVHGYLKNSNLELHIEVPLTVWDTVGWLYVVTTTVPRTYIIYLV
jgi:hypothetical protein